MTGGWEEVEGGKQMEVPLYRAHPTETSPRVKPITGSTFPGGKEVSALNLSLSPPLLGNIFTLVKAGRRGIRRLRKGKDS